ncbi:efflux RND transporter periplasmic adaptor subunit [Vibrio sp. JPW-9-11-11]|nr:efflux RND transporter periplasmic adaptor subunit [Vibrio sp. JPW-9-11-11]NVD07834.1 efflux RND transporter periplasmic adaptor subunit [Vibrio sp. JPW-9-11-11]
MSRVVLLATTVCLLSACMPETPHRAAPALSFDTYTVAKAEQSHYRSFNGQVMPAELTPLSFRISGELMSVLVKEGDNVTKGQTLAILTDSKAKQDLSDAQARYELALKQVNRASELRASAMISSAEYDQLKANYQLAKANLSAAKAQISYTRLKAPFAGVVSSVDKKRFENISASEPVVSIYQADRVQIKLDVSDSVLASLNPQVRYKSYQPTATFTGYDGEYSVSYLEHTSERHPESQTYQLWLTMPQVPTEILPGTSAKVTVNLREAGMAPYQAYQVPLTAIEAGNEAHQFYVWKLEQGRASKHRVNIEQVTKGGATVLTGVKQGDLLINSNLRKLRQGMEIKGAQG